jgi:hypothetical protein
MSEIYTTYAIKLKGYCPLNVCWQYIHDVATQLSELGTNAPQPIISLDNVEIQEGKFTLSSKPSTTDMAANVWLLAATSIELINGSPIFNGKGEKSQNAASPIPQLPQEEAKTLNLLLHSCLNYDKTKRPNFAEIADIAAKELDKCSTHQRQSRVSLCAVDRQKQNEIDSQWPEAMIVNIRKVITVIIFTISLFNINAQNFLKEHNEVEMQTLVDNILLLRNNNEKSWDAAQDNFRSHINDITLMTKLIDRNNDCILSGRKRFFVNIIINELKRNGRVQFSSKEFLDGQENHVPYSIIEKGIKNGATATYTIKNRSGQQCFAIIPFSAGQKYSPELRIGNGTLIEPSYKDVNGITYYFFDSGKASNDGNNAISLKISNKDKVNNAVFVIVNHNPKNR